MKQEPARKILNRLFEQFETVPNDPMLGMTGCAAQAVRNINFQTSCLLSKLTFIDRVERQDPALKAQFSRLRSEKDVSNTYHEISGSIQDINQAYLPFVRTMRQSGHLQKLLENWRVGLINAGSVDILELMQETLKHERVRDELERSGVTRNLEALLGYLEDTDVSCKVQNNQLKYEVNLNGDSRQGILNIPNQPQELTSIGDLINRDNVDHLLHTLSTHGLVNVLIRGHHAPDELVEMDLDQVLVGAATIPISAMHRRARLIEDVGLPSYQGDQGWDVGWVIGAIIAFVIGASLLGVGIGLAIDCASSGGDCTVATILIVLGVIGIVLGFLFLSFGYDVAAGSAVTAGFAAGIFE